MNRVKCQRLCRAPSLIAAKMGIGQVLYKAMSRANTSPEQIGEELLGIAL